MLNGANHVTTYMPRRAYQYLYTTNWECLYSTLALLFLFLLWLRNPDDRDGKGKSTRLRDWHWTSWELLKWHDRLREDSQLTCTEISELVVYFSTLRQRFCIEKCRQIQCEAHLLRNTLTQCQSFCCLPSSCLNLFCKLLWMKLQSDQSRDYDDTLCATSKKSRCNPQLTPGNLA